MFLNGSSRCVFDAAAEIVVTVFWNLLRIGRLSGGQYERVRVYPSGAFTFTQKIEQSPKIDARVGPASVCGCMCLYVPVCVCLCMSVYVCVCMYMHASVCVYKSWHHQEPSQAKPSHTI
jgi:hypothetical protein